MLFFPKAILRVVTNGLIISELTLQELPKLKTFGMSTWRMHVCNSNPEERYKGTEITLDIGKSQQLEGHCCVHPFVYELSAEHGVRE